jgi:ABC-type polysaccharide/polyol phosphate export permease
VERTPSVREDLAEIVRDFAGSRELLVELTRRDLRIRYKQSIVGVAWALLTPLMVIGSGWLVRLVVATMAGEVIDGGAFAGIAVKSVGWAFFVGALGFGTSSLTQNLALVTKVYFPRELLPLSAILTQLVDSAIGAAALAFLLPLVGVRPGLAWLWAPALILVLVSLTAALTLLLACINVFFRDARHAVQLILSFGIFVTPVFFDAAAYGPTGARLVMLNPLAPVLEGLRLALVEGHNLAAPLLGASGALVWSPWWLLYSTTVAVAGLAGSALIFHRAEFKFAEYV